MLEIGCGTGRYTRQWATHASFYVALERSAPMLALARCCCETGPAGPSFVLADATKLPLADAPAAYVTRERERHGIDELALGEAATLMLDKLPAVHADPFDRLLVCQAIHHGLTLLTPDPSIHRYPVPVQW